MIGTALAVVAFGSKIHWFLTFVMINNPTDKENVEILLEKSLFMEFTEAASPTQVHIADLTAEHTLVSQAFICAVPTAT